jgi:tetratricopeptide (TPR) repeat protein
MALSRSDGAFETLPDPGRAGTLDELVERLRLLKTLAGNPSYDTITRRVNAAWRANRPSNELAGKTTVRDCFRLGRRRLNTDLVVAVVAALHPDAGYVTQWRQALHVIAGETQAAAQVRVQDALPQDLPGFSGRTAELDQLHRALHHGAVDGGAVVISAIAGMAGVGKTQLAVRAGHVLVRAKVVDRVLFVNLRGFHPDSAQPPADPIAVLDGFLRLLGVPGQQIPHDLPARAALYRDRLAGTRTLVVLDNALDVDQVHPLLPGTPGCPALVTSRRSLTDLRPATHLDVDVFAPGEALAFLAEAAPHVPAGPDPHAATRIAHRCGHLPLALGLVSAHIRAKPGWTLTDHADRLDERHHDRRLDSGVELALDLSYRQLPADRQRLLRLAALHPGQDLDAHAAAALAGSDLPAAQDLLHELCRDHLLQQDIPGRYTFHDLVRAYAIGRSGDEDSPPERRAALSRLFDYCLGTAAAAMDTLYPAETDRRPKVPRPGTPVPALTDPDSARAWLDAERPTLVAVAAHTATRGWPAHITRLSATLSRYLNGGHHADALTIHGHAAKAARHTGDPAGEAYALTNLGAVHSQLGKHEAAGAYLRQALHLFQQAGDPAGQARALGNLGSLENRLGRYRQAVDYQKQALVLNRQTGDHAGEASALHNLGVVEARLGRYRQAIEHHQEALVVNRQSGNRTGEAWTLNGLGGAEQRLGRYGPAAGYYLQALALHRQNGDRTGEASTLDNLGTLHTCLVQPAEAIEYHQQALAIVRETGDRVNEAWALNGLGEAANIAGRAADALGHHTAGLTVATDIGSRAQQARAHEGLGHAHHSLGNPTHARQHYQHALTLYSDLGLPAADKINARLAVIDTGKPCTAVPRP